VTKKKRKLRAPERRLVGLRGLLKKAALEQSELADKLGIDKTTVSHWVTGKNGAPYPRLLQVAELLDCTVDDLFREAA
jgi:transcriptional regulator with XRE-family HTH domain